MSRALASRIAKLEPRPVPTVIPHIVTVERGETARVAVARFFAEYGSKISPRHGLIVIPASIEAEGEDEFAARFEAQQRALVAMAKSPPQKKDEFNG